MNKDKLKKNIILNISPLLLLIIFISGCGGKVKHYGTQIPKDAPIIKMQDIMNNPGHYHAKKVVMKGLVAAQCPSFCWISFREGIHTVKIFFQGFKSSKLNRNTPIKVYTQITAGEESTVFSAIGLEVLKGEQ